MKRAPRSTITITGDTLVWLQWLAKTMKSTVNQLALDFINSSRVEVESEEAGVPHAVKAVRQFLRYELTVADKLLAEELRRLLPEWDDMPPFKQRIAIRYASAMTELDLDEIRDVLESVGNSDLHVALAELK